MDKQSHLPETPGRGRSRFSKALPTPPAPFVLPTRRERSPSSTSGVQRNTLPPLPEGKSKMPPTISIPRRPVGGQPSRSKPLSIASISSVYSDSPALSHSQSDSSSHTRGSMSGIESDIGPTPPLPPKDGDRQHVFDAPTTPNNPLSSPSSSWHSSPPRTEIWRRRSVRSDRSIHVPELRLERSNGSTASPPQDPPPDRLLPAISGTLPRSKGGLDTSAGRKPVPVRPAPPQPDAMGSKFSKLKDKLKERDGHDAEQEEPRQPTSPFTRLPTPEYDDQLETALTQPAVSPMSPNPPETPPDDVPPQVPQKSLSSRRLAPAPAISEKESHPGFLSAHSRESSDTLTISSEAPVMRSPQPKKVYAAKILTPQPSPCPSPGNSASDQISPNETSTFTRRYPAAGLGIMVPRLPSPAAEETMPKISELNVVQLDCYQSHKSMRNSKNNVCPVACMLCKSEASDMRWRCTWCCLRCCGECMHVLASIPGRDLRVCLERIGGT